MSLRPSSSGASARSCRWSGGDGSGPGCDREVETLLGELAKGVISDEDFRFARRRLDADRTAWLERLAEIQPLIADEELSVRAAEAVADTLSGVTIHDLDLQQRRWLLAQIDFVMTLACEDWRAKSQERRYDVTSRWAGQALLGESATRDYLGNPNGPPTITRPVPHLMEKHVELSGLRGRAARAA